MEATPLEQVLAVAVAVYCTGEVTVEPALGVVTVTVARAGAAIARKIVDTRLKSFMVLSLINEAKHSL